MSTNLPRVTQKIFGENAGQNIGQFGSALAGQGNPTGDIEEIQALPAWEGGWNSAVISERDYPPLEEMTGIQKVETQQIAYLMQKGIPEWDAGTTYFANVSFCQINGLVYRSLTDNNLGNNPATDTTNWEVWKPLEGNYANTDLSNLTSTGEKHFVNKTQLTNCILEIPQNIKYTLEDGVLTIKAGTIVTVPYGTTDQSATYPVGATFINNNFKVVKTYFTNNKFFVQAEVQADISISSTSDAAGIKRLVYIILSVNGIGIIARNLSTTSEDTLTGNSFNYRTDLNLVQRKLSTGITSDVTSLPIMAVTSDETSFFAIINRVFNGMGYIGATVFLLPGVRWVAPNGKNPDGTNSNVFGYMDYVYVEQILNTSVKILSFYCETSGIFHDIGQSVIFDYIDTVDELQNLTSGYYAYIRTENLIYVNGARSDYPLCGPVGRVDVISDNGNLKITDFQFNTTFLAADDQTVLHKYGNETAYGDKVFANDLSVGGVINIQNDIVLTKTENDYGSLLYFNKAADYTALTPGTEGGRILTNDKNGQFFGYYQVLTDINTNTLRSQIGARRVVSGATKSGVISLEINTSGDVFGTAPTYTANYADSSTKIVTTAYMANHWVTGRATTTSSASKARPAVVVQNYVSGTSWYRVWSDGWIEQGGRVQLTSQNTTGTVVSFLKAFQNTNYSVNAMVERYTSSAVSYTDDSTVLIQGLATNNMTLVLWDANNNSYKAYVRWRACGY